MVQPETEEREEEETTEVEYQNGSSLGQWPIQGQDKPLCPYRGLGQRIPSFRSHISRILLSYFTRCPLPALSFPRVFHTLPPSATSGRLSFFALSLFGTVQSSVLPSRSPSSHRRLFAALVETGPLDSIVRCARHQAFLSFHAPPYNTYIHITCKRNTRTHILARSSGNRIIFV